MTLISTDEANRAGLNLLAMLDGIEQAHAGLAGEDVHRVRVAIKQTRAWLKLCRGVTGETTAYKQLLASLRELSTKLAGQRDRDVAQLTLAKLVRKYPGKKAQRLVTILSQQLAQHPPLLPQTVLAHATVEQIRQALLPFTQLAVPRAIQADVFIRTFEKMCKAGDAALATEACSELHAWRKRVKTVAYQLAMIELGEAKRHKLPARLTRLGSKLGAIHDLCFLQVMIEEIAGQLQDELDLAPLRKRIAREHSVLIGAVHKLQRQVCLALPHVQTRAKLA